MISEPISLSPNQITALEISHLASGKL